MRRKEKTILIGVALFGAGTIIYEIIRQWLEKSKTNQALTLDNFDYKRTFKLAVRNCIIGGLSAYVYYSYRIDTELTMPFEPDRYLRDILAEELLSSNPIYLDQAISLKEKVKSKLTEAFKEKLVSHPLDAGSFAKRTAISSGYDLDIVLAFSKHSYVTLEEMHKDVFHILRETFGDTARITNQTKAITLSFETNREGYIELDVVPGREINDFEKDKELNLYVRPNFIWQRGSSFKTNFYQQRHITMNKPEARKIIKLLKKYFVQNNLDIPAIVIEQCVVEALSEDQFGIHFSITENLLNAMDYLASKLQQKIYIDYSNSNNNLNDKVSHWEKNRVSSLLSNDIKKIEENPRYLIEIFE